MRKIDAFLLVEKYRPETIDDCILPERIKSVLKEQIKKKQINNMLFSGTAGLGKTSAAKAICQEIGADVLYLNFSNETGIDTVRHRVAQFASTVSFDGNLKVIIGDEFERLSVQGQDALKAMIEQFHKTTRFIFTTNNKNRIIDPILSRCVDFEFNPTEAEKPELITMAFARVVKILKAEQIEYDGKSVAALVKKYYPDLRKILNEIQRYSASGTIDSGILVQENTTLDTLIEHLKNKKFGDVRKWLARNPDLDHQALFRHFYDNLTELFNPSSIPDAVLILAQYQYYATRVIDQEINTMACLIELVKDVQWK